MAHEPKVSLSVIEEERLSLESSDDPLLSEKQDLEAQRTAQILQPTHPDDEVSTRQKFFFLGLYFVFNLGVVLSNKAVLKMASLPWLLTVSHTSATSIGCTMLYLTGHFKLSKLSIKENLILVGFSTLFTLNIAISNVSLSYVSIPFHQVMRSTCPVVTILIYRVVYNRTYSTATYLSMIPLILGVALATFGDYYFSLMGFALTMLGVISASVKTVTTNRLLTGSLQLSAMEVLFRMSPLAAAQCLLYAAANGELKTLNASIAEGAFSVPHIIAIVVNASMAFGLNLVSFQTNKIAGALTVSVCGNVKQCLAIVLGIVLFNMRITLLNSVGLAIAVSGAAYYSKIELDRKRGST